jgi:hypothetical protein
VRDYEKGGNFSLVHAERIIGGLDGTYELGPLSRSDLTLARDGNDLTISRPDYTFHGAYGDQTVAAGMMTLVSFFSRGLAQVRMDEFNIDVSGLAYGPPAVCDRRGLQRVRRPLGNSGGVVVLP